MDLFKIISDAVKTTTHEENPRRDMKKILKDIEPSAGDKIGIFKSTTYATEPAVGTVVYCELLFGNETHSGIYVGNKKIVDLNGKGEIKQVSLKEFTSNLTTLNSEVWFPCDVDTGHAIGSSIIANRASEMIGKYRNYNLVLDNCHQFSSGCISGDYENADNFIWMLKDTFQKKFNNKIKWVKWNWK
jgi:hypothetical protein